MAENLSDWLRLVVPEKTVNLIRNPSFEKNLDTWDDSGTGATRVVGGRYGAWAASFLAVASGNALITDYETVSEGGDYTVTVPVQADSDEVIVELVIVGVSLVSVAHSGSGEWEDLTATISTTASQNLIVRVKDTRASGWTPIKVDGVQLERKSYSTTYCDGDQPDCRWIGTAHRSPSSRPDNARLGGRSRSFADMGIKVRSMAGAGMVPITNVTQSYAIRDGAEYYRASVPQRVITLICTFVGASPQGLHTLRQLLISSMMRPKGQGEPLYLEYQQEGKRLRLKVRYEGGHEFGDQTANFEMVPLRFLAVQPYWEAAHDDAMELEQLTISPVIGGLAHRNADGEWAGVGTAGLGADDIGSISALAYAPDGTLWVGGNFSTIGGVTVSDVAYYDGVSWHRPGSATFANFGINAFAFKPNGDVIIFGTEALQGTANVIGVEYSPETNTFGTTYTDHTAGQVREARCAAMHPLDGSLWYGGTFTNSGAGVGISSVPFYSVGVTGGNQRVNSIVIADDGTIYIGGSFTGIGGDSATNVAKLPYGNSQTSGWEAVGSGLNGEVHKLAISKSGILYAAGAFSLTVGALSAFGAAYFDGNDWQAAGQGFISTDGTGLDVAIDPIDDQPVFLTKSRGAFNAGTMLMPAAYQTSETGGLQKLFLTNLYRWNGTNWTIMDFSFTRTHNPSGGSDVHAQKLAFGPNGELAVGGNSADAGFISPTVHEVEVDAPTPVHIKFISPPPSDYPCFYANVRNMTTRKALNFINLVSSYVGDVDLSTDEEDPHVTIYQMTSRGMSALTSDSSLLSFKLMPGVNRISAWMPPYPNSTGSPVTTPPAATARCILYWRERFYSVDGVLEE